MIDEEVFLEEEYSLAQDLSWQYGHIGNFKREQLPDETRDTLDRVINENEMVVPAILGHINKSKKDEIEANKVGRRWPDDVLHVNPYWNMGYRFEIVDYEDLSEVINDQNQQGKPVALGPVKYGFHNFMFNWSFEDGNLEGDMLAAGYNDGKSINIAVEGEQYLPMESYEGPMVLLYDVS